MAKASHAVRGGLGVGMGLGAARKANAFGDSKTIVLPEFEPLGCYIAEYRFNVPDQEALIRVFEESLFLSVLSSKSDRVTRTNTTTLAFGPSSIDKTKIFKWFTPGISDISQYGGHACITLVTERGEDEDTIPFFELGNGLQYMQMGVPDLKLSKALMFGSELSYSYGWVDMMLPGQVPVQIIIGDRRDPIMFTCLKVSDVARSTEWYTRVLGMKEMPLIRARPPESQFEPPAPPNSRYLGYDSDTPGVLLVPVAKNEKVVPGGVFAYTRIVVDESRTDSPLVNSINNGIVNVQDPDGYRYLVTPYSDWKSHPSSTFTPQ